MDTSETYIKMCEKAEEIQDTNRMWKRGDYERKPSNEEIILEKMNFYAYSGDEGYYYLANLAEDYTWNGTVCGYVRIPEYHFGCAVRGDLPIAYTAQQIIWLPRQDQLQEMVGVTKAWQFLEWIKRISFEAHTPPQVFLQYKQEWSMEQLWSAFVMKEEYNKTWDGEEWKQNLT